MLNFVVPLWATNGIGDDSVNLLQTAIQKHKSPVPTGKKECVAKGDPHIKLWSQPHEEGAQLGLYGTYADYWLVKTDALKVMARVGGVAEFDMGVIKGVAVTGPLMENKVLIVPTINDGDVTFGGKPIEFPWTSPGGNVTIKYGWGNNWNAYGSKKKMRKRDNTFLINMGDKAEIEINQDVFQHFQIVADEDIVADDKGLCKNECEDWFKCQNPICDLSCSCNKSWPNGTAALKVCFAEDSFCKLLLVVCCSWTLTIGC